MLTPLFSDLIIIVYSIHTAYMFLMCQHGICRFGYIILLVAGGVAAGFIAPIAFLHLSVCACVCVYTIYITITK